MKSNDIVGKGILENLRLSESRSSSINATDVISIHAPHLFVDFFKPRFHLRLTRQTQAVQLLQQNLKQKHPNPMTLKQSPIRVPFNVLVPLGNSLDAWLNEQSPMYEDES